MSCPCWQFKLQLPLALHDPKHDLLDTGSDLASELSIVTLKFVTSSVCSALNVSGHRMVPELIPWTSPGGMLLRCACFILLELPATQFALV